jgi:hypothetical protein
VLFEALDVLGAPADPISERILDAGRATLGETGFAAAWAGGRAMPLDQAMEYALLAPDGFPRAE